MLDLSTALPDDAPRPHETPCHRAPDLDLEAANVDSLRNQINWDFPFPSVNRLTARGFEASQGVFPPLDASMTQCICGHSANPAANPQAVAAGR
ncbi:hypothetical protein [Zavarzinia sp. CC-PAN008]|uniref:hypothetical protein n=1 Tax=Zavarzinia sp. CC-PAN008 TaxID=3243332 RepID=UPI003F743A97